MHLPEKKIFFALFLIILLIIGSCANVVSPTGGPKDEQPPRVLRSTPPNYSPNYNGEEIRIYFDEFVELKELSQNLLVSPPLKNDPEIRLRGRSVVINIEDTLRENTTYNLFFGESIVDITEGNPLSNFQFVFSTGDYVDSLSVQGKAIDAATLEPAPDAFVMLYDSIFDSVPMLRRPVYVSKTNEEGAFNIRNMRDDEYLMFALTDMNSNYLYDSPDEIIAFSDSLIKPEFIPFLHHNYETHQEEADTTEADARSGQTQTDTLEQTENDTTEVPVSEDLPPDTTRTDSLTMEEIMKYDYYTLRMFQEEDTVQRLISSNLERKGKLNFIFRIPTDSLVFKDIRQPLDKDDLILEKNPPRNDTIIMWVPDQQRDSLFLEISDRGNVIDTANVSLVPRTARGTVIEDENEEEPQLDIDLMPGGSRTQYPFFQPFTLESTTPLANIQTNQWQFFVSDSIPLEASFRIEGAAKKQIITETTLEPDSTYKLIVPPATIFDIFGTTNDTLEYSIRTSTSEDYGTIIVNLQLPENHTAENGEIHLPDSLAPVAYDSLLRITKPVWLQATDSLYITDSLKLIPLDTINTLSDTALVNDTQKYILQLLNENWEVLREKYISKTDIYYFRYLKTGNFRLRLVLDENENQKWDTGNYLEQKQPEKVYIYPDKIESRLNWEIEAIWNVAED
ncbi:MAG: Ig-like domain-containing protein [Bacteroidota bacterium]